MSCLASMETWPGSPAGAAVLADGTIERFGDTERPYQLASLTKLYTALAVLVAHEEGTLPLHDEVGPGYTAADLLSHTAGFAPDETRQIAEPRQRRIYSTGGYDVVASAVAERAEMPFDEYAAAAVAQPLGMKSFTLTGSAGKDAQGSVEDLLILAEEWANPTLIDSRTHANATLPYYGGLGGALPGYGTYNPNPWGMGPEIRGAKSPHWTAANNDPSTYGHFGRTGTMLWIDPVANTRTIALNNIDFGPWATSAWPPLSASVLQASNRGG